MSSVAMVVVLVQVENMPGRKRGALQSLCLVFCIEKYVESVSNIR